MSQFLYKLVVFDLDGTLHSHDDNHKDNVVLKKEIYDILNFLKKNGIKIALASLNSNASKYLKRYNIFEYFDYIEYKNWMEFGDHKSDLFSFIQKKSDISYNEMILFDDRDYHVSEAVKLQMKAIKVNGETLLTWEDMMKGFCSFNYNHILLNKDTLALKDTLAPKDTLALKDTLPPKNTLAPKEKLSYKDVLLLDKDVLLDKKLTPEGAFTDDVDKQQGVFTDDVDKQQGTFTDDVDKQQGTFTQTNLPKYKYIHKNKKRKVKLSIE